MLVTYYTNVKLDRHKNDPTGRERETMSEKRKKSIESMWKNINKKQSKTYKSLYDGNGRFVCLARGRHRRCCFLLIDHFIVFVFSFLSLFVGDAAVLLYYDK